MRRIRIALALGLAWPATGLAAGDKPLIAPPPACVTPVALTAAAPTSPRR